MSAARFASVPAELRELPRWVVWRWDDELDPETSKRPKPPFCPTNLRRHASSTNESTWGTFEQAVARVEAEEADGIGFALGPPYVGVDLDKELSPADQGAVMLKLDSYSEESASGTGYHVVVRASLNGRGRHPAGIGVFQAERFFYFTGQHVPGTPLTIEERQAELEAVMTEFMPARGANAPRQAQPVDVDDRDLLERALRAKNGALFGRLLRGDTTGYPSPSEADLALCSMLAFWTGRDPERMDRIFRASGLYREKWNREDYREATIGEAIAGCTEVFQPASARNVGGTPERSRASDSVDSEESASGDRGSNGVTESAVKDSVAPDSVSAVKKMKPAGTESNSVADSVTPFALDVRDFIARPREHREPILADIDGRAVIGHRSLSLCGGLGGSGKTTFFIDLALHLVAGVDYPPFTVPAAISVLMIENEGPEDLFAEKLRARLATFEHELRGRLGVCVFDWGGFNLAVDVHRERLANEIADKGYDLIFGDPLDSLGIAGVGSPEDTRVFMALMKQAGLNKTCAWWLNTHPRKEETKEALNEISGAWGGKPDSVLLLKMLADDRTQVRFPKLRWVKRGKRPSILLAYDPETEGFSYLGEESEDERDYLADITALFKNGKWRIAKEIAAPKKKGGIGANEKVVKGVLGEHPEVFESRTGDEAKALGRSATATVWNLRTGEKQAPEQEPLRFPEDGAA